MGYGQWEMPPTVTSDECRVTRGLGQRGTGLPTPAEIRFSAGSLVL